MRCALFLAVIFGASAHAQNAQTSKYVKSSPSVGAAAAAATELVITRYLAVVEAGSDMIEEKTVLWSESPRDLGNLFSPRASTVVVVTKTTNIVQSVVAVPASTTTDPAALAAGTHPYTDASPTKFGQGINSSSQQPASTTFAFATASFGSNSASSLASWYGTSINSNATTIATEGISTARFNSTTIGTNAHGPSTTFATSKLSVSAPSTVFALVTTVSSQTSASHTLPATTTSTADGGNGFSGAATLHLASSANALLHIGRLAVGEAARYLTTYLLGVVIAWAFLV